MGSTVTITLADGRRLDGRAENGMLEPGELEDKFLRLTRGTLGEANPSQVPMGRATPAILDALDIQAFNLSDPAQATAMTEGALTLAFSTGTGAAVVLDAILGGGREAI